MRRERGAYRYRRMQMLEGYGEDAYRPARKPRGAMQCPRCLAVFRDGRWAWGAARGAAQKRRCPACRRILERYPAGYVTLSGGFFEARRAEVLALARHCEERESAEHPLERIMKIERDEGATVVTTTSTHLARLIAHALHRAFKGSLRMTYNRQDNVLRARWSRAAD